MLKPYYNINYNIKIIKLTALQKIAFRPSQKEYKVP